MLCMEEPASVCIFHPRPPLSRCRAGTQERSPFGLIRGTVSDAGTPPTVTLYPGTRRLALSVPPAPSPSKLRSLSSSKAATSPPSPLQGSLFHCFFPLSSLSVVLGHVHLSVSIRNSLSTHHFIPFPSLLPCDTFAKKSRTQTSRLFFSPGREQPTTCLHHLPVPRHGLTGDLHAALPSPLATTEQTDTARADMAGKGKDQTPGRAQVCKCAPPSFRRLLLKYQGSFKSVGGAFPREEYQENGSTSQFCTFGWRPPVHPCPAFSEPSWHLRGLDWSRPPWPQETIAHDSLSLAQK